MEPPPGSHEDQRGLHPVRRIVLRFVVATLISAVVVAPLALSWAVTHTEVRQLVGITPTTFALTTAGHSELRLGIAGTFYIPQSRGPLGVVATVDGPGVPELGTGDLASYATPEMLQLYTGLFHDPQPAVEGYLHVLAAELLRQLVVAEVFLALVGGLTWVTLELLLRRRESVLSPSPEASPLPMRASGIAGLGVLLAVTSVLAFLQMRPARGDWVTDTAATVYELPSLEGTIAEGTTTTSPLLRGLLAGAVPKVEDLVQRQEDRDLQYRSAAVAGLQAQAALMAGPRAGETAVLMQSDMHCNTTMIRLQRQVVSMLRGRFGADVPALLAITGDLTTNGTAAEAGCIEAEAAIAQGVPMTAVTGNHESEVSVEQMEGVGIKVLTGETTELAGVSVLGDGDPERSELFGATRLRGEETQQDVGARLYDVAVEDRPQLLLVHEAYAAQAFIGTTDISSFLQDRADATTRYDDGVRDLPASAVLYGHWHRSIDPRVVWNSDGTWTLVMELDTSGGAIDTPTIGHFSTPWSSPEQNASFPVLFLDEDSGLVTGYQLYDFDIDGTVTIHPRVDIGDFNPTGGDDRSSIGNR